MEALSPVLQVVAVVAIGFPLLMYLIQDRLIFYPQPLPGSHREVVLKRFPGIEALFIESADGTRLHGWHVKPAPGEPLVMYFGGNAEQVSWMLDEVSRRAPGTGWLLVDYRGYGASAGVPSEAALVSDALQWYDAVAGRARQVFVFGRSLGGGVAVKLAAERAVAGVILVAPFDSLVEVAKHYYPFLPVNWMLRHRFESIALAPKIGAPLLCLVAARDEIIPAAHSRRLYDAWGGPKRWVDLDGGHNSTDGAPVFWPSILRFLEENRGQSPISDGPKSP